MPVEPRRGRPRPQNRSWLLERNTSLEFDPSNESDCANILNTTLRLRGFLVFTKSSQVYLFKGSCHDDIRDLRECGLMVRPAISGIDPVDSLAIVSAPTTSDMIASLERVLKLRRADPGLVWIPFASARKDFKRIQYGPKVPARDLDPGVALLVKILPVLGIYTVLSCDGHLERLPRIWVASHLYLAWARFVFSQLESTLDKNGLECRFDDEDRWGGFLEFHSNQGDFLYVLERVHRFACDLLDAPLLLNDIRSQRF